MARKPRGQHYKSILRDPGDYRFIVAIDIAGAKDLPDAYRQLRTILPKECSYESTDEAYGPSGKTIAVPYLNEVRSRVLAEEEPSEPLPAICLIRPDDREVFTPNKDGTFSNHWMRASYPGHHIHSWSEAALRHEGFTDGTKQDISQCERRAQASADKFITSKATKARRFS